MSMDIIVTQFVRPDGKQKLETIHQMPDDLKPILQSIKECGGRLTAEVIFSDVAFTIDCPKGEVDFDMEICPNGPLPDATAGPRQGLEKLIRRFDAKKFREMESELNEERARD